MRQHYQPIGRYPALTADTNPSPSPRPQFFATFFTVHLLPLETRLTQVVLEKRPLNACSRVVTVVQQCACLLVVVRCSFCSATLSGWLRRTLLILILLVFDCLHSMQSRVSETVERPSVCLSVPPIIRPPLRWVCCCAAGRQEISIDCCTAGAQQQLRRSTMLSSKCEQCHADS